MVRWAARYFLHSTSPSTYARHKGRYTEANQQHQACISSARERAINRARKQPVRVRLMAHKRCWAVRSIYEFLGRFARCSALPFFEAKNKITTGRTAEHDGVAVAAEMGNIILTTTSCSSWLAQPSEERAFRPSRFQTRPGKQEKGRDRQTAETPRPDTGGASPPLPEFVCAV